MEKRTLQKLCLLCASVALCSAASWWNSNEEADQQVKKLAEQPVVEQVQEIKITVCVSGAVAKPGLYEVTKGSRYKNHSVCQRRSGQAGTLRSDKRQPGAAGHRTGRRCDGGGGHGQGKPGPVMQRRRTHQSSETVKGEAETENAGTKICKGRRYFRGNNGGRAL